MGQTCRAVASSEEFPEEGVWKLGMGLVVMMMTAAGGDIFAVTDSCFITMANSSNQSSVFGAWADRTWTGRVSPKDLLIRRKKQDEIKLGLGWRGRALKILARTGVAGLRLLSARDVQGVCRGLELAPRSMKVYSNVYHQSALEVLCSATTRTHSEWNDIRNRLHYASLIAHCLRGPHTGTPTVYHHPRRLEIQSRRQQQSHTSKVADTYFSA